MSENIYNNGPVEPEQMEETDFNTPGVADEMVERVVDIYESTDFFQDHEAETKSAVHQQPLKNCSTERLLGKGQYNKYIQIYHQVTFVILVTAVTVLRIKAGAEVFGSMFTLQGGRNKLRHRLTLLSGLLESLFFTGLAFGWASLVFVLKIDGYFAGHCANTTREEDYAVHMETSVLLYPAMSCLITSGTILHLTNVQVGNLFDNYRSTVINIYNGAYDSSAAVFLIIKAAPVEAEEKEKEENEMKDQKRKKADDETPASDLLQKTPHEPEQVQATFQSCVMSWLFLWHLVWVVTILFCQFIFLSTVNPMLTRLANNDQTLVSHYTNAFAFTQLCGVLVAPVNGLIMDRYKRRPLAPGETKREADLRSSSLALFLTSLQCFLFCVCFTCPVLPLQYLTFVLQVVNSTFFYGGHQAFVSIAFPMSHFGKMSGMAMSLSALVLLLQLPIHRVIQHQLHGDPLYVNVGVTLVSLLAFIHPLHVSLYCRKLAKQRKTEREVNEPHSAKC
ncbi:Solute carrier family 43 member 3 [Nibea albiflora]|uniref:Solute carrier family 43 member 3 n=1 Tax=Nibea albiflora TaxID=240163 RepID=A0ACB7FLB8_NIBAL|nr:Solute carrier family 43 member 3 [Nibea albiflora]